MADGKVKTPLTYRITLLGMVAVVSALIAGAFSSNVFAYTANDPEARYNCYQLDDKGNFVHETDTNGKETDQLVPCKIDTGDNAWM